MKPAPRKREETSATLAPTLWGIAGLSLTFILAASAADPSWWSSRQAVVPPQVTTNAGVVTTNYVPNPDAVVTQGQLKQFTARAVDELNANFATYGGSGTTLSNLVYGWQQDYATNNYYTNTSNPSAPYKPSDFTAVNVGQLKYIGNLVWGRLAAGGYTNAVPSWLAQNTNTDNVVAVIGQVKEIFNFDLTRDSDGNGLPDWWELEYFGHLGNDPSSSPDGNGLSLLQDYQQGNNPTNYYSQGGTNIAPTLSVTGGNNQTGPTSTFLTQALTVTVTDSNNNPIFNAPVVFTTTGSAGGNFSASLGGPATASLTVMTDFTGTAQAYYAGSSNAGATATVQAAAGTSTVTFSEMTDVNDGSIAAPSGITQAQGSGDGQIVLNWTNHATNASYLLIQQSIDNVNWLTIGTINDPTVSTYTVIENNPHQSYYFGVVAGSP